MVAILLTLFVVGCCIGFVGAGGAGVVIAVLTFFFDVPIHVALGTSLGAMAFTTFSGTLSHYREGNVVPRIGWVVGLFGAGGAFCGAKISASIAGVYMHWLTAGMLVLSAILLYMKIFHPNNPLFSHSRPELLTRGKKFWISALLAGLANGLISGTFGIGAAAFVQLSLLFVFGISIYQAVGTTMLVILPIAVMGGVGYLTSGFIELLLFAEVVAGMMSGAYIGAKFTRLANPLFLKIAMVAIPLLGATLLLV